MGLFSKKTKDDDKQPTVTTDEKSASVKTAKKVENKPSMKELYGSDKPTAVKKSEDKDAKVEKKTNTGRAYRILIKPLITEKASNLGADNKYVFAVSIDANKIEIAKAINDVYGIIPSAVNVVNVRGKKASYRRIVGKRKDWRKAIVTLPAGKTIKIYEGI